MLNYNVGMSTCMFELYTALHVHMCSFVYIVKDQAIAGMTTSNYYYFIPSSP